MQVKSIFKAIPRTEKASSTVSGTYAAINPNGLPFPCSKLIIVNDSDSQIDISFDGSTDHDFCRKQADRDLGAQESGYPNSISNFPKGLKVYVSGSAGTGNIYLIGYYQPRAIQGA